MELAFGYKSYNIELPERNGFYIDKNDLWEILANDVYPNLNPETKDEEYKPYPFFVKGEKKSNVYSTMSGILMQVKENWENMSFSYDFPNFISLIYINNNDRNMYYRKNVPVNYKEPKKSYES